MKLKLSFAFLALVFCLFVPKAHAYPGFVSYGYATCITCHYNGQGGGALNDYGRGLFATELAARGPFNSATDEQLVARSGFLGSKPLPWWFRPGAKYRGLYFETNPGASNTVRKYITMQADVNAAFFLDKHLEKMIMVSVGYSPTPMSQQGRKDPKDKNLISREHYLRWQNSPKLFTYYGLMDKAFGLRIADHTAYNRAATGVAMNDQTHGVMAQYYGESGWELTGHGFLGNLLQEEANVQQRGLAMMYEKDLAEKNRLGVGVMTSKNEFVQRTRLEVHSKLGLQKGNSILSEVGFIKDTPQSGPDKDMGAYAFLEASYFIRRGYNLISQVEYFNASLGPESPDAFRWTFGLLAFPVSRVEWRATFVNGRTITDSAVTPDQWMLQTQLHLSL